MASEKVWEGNTAFNGQLLPSGNQSKGRLWFSITRLSSLHSTALSKTE